MNRTLIRRLPLPVRAAIQIVIPTGEHRARRTIPVLLPDGPLPAPTAPVPCEVLDEDVLLRLLDEGEAEVLECALCPCCDRITAHAMGPDSRRCWTCGTETRVDGAA